jgi:hypothetical protein
MGFVDDSQFGGLDRPGNIKSFESLRDLLLGKQHYPKVIVADIPPGEIWKKQDLLVKLVNQYNLRNRTSYKPHFSSWMELRSAWMLADPTKPGRSRVSYPTGLRLARHFFSTLNVIGSSKKFLAEEDFESMLAAYRGEQREAGSRESKFRQKNYKKKYQDVSLFLGIVFVVRFWPSKLPLDLYWSEGIQRRVRAHLAKELQQRKTGYMPVHPMQRAMRVGRPMPQRGMYDWYVMGAKEAPLTSNRLAQTKSGRVKPLHTYEPGRGFRRLHVTDRETLKPLFVVRGRNVDAAREAADKKIEAMIMNPATSEQGYMFAQQWARSGQKVISRTALQKYREP